MNTRALIIVTRGIFLASTLTALAACGGGGGGSSPPAMVAVPNVVGSTQAAATTSITGAGLTVGTVTMQSSATVASGNVISENPAAATSVAKGSAVALVVSSGPAMVAVPNVVGNTQAAATTAITGAGLTVGTVTMQSSATVASGNVISENPAAGTSVASGSAVALVVSSGAGTASYVTGTAAGGAPLASATVTLVDSSGKTATATTAADGSFKVTVTNLTAPFLLSVQSSGTMWYSYASASSTTANLTPYTSVVLQAYYTALGTTVSGVLAGTITATSFPSNAQLTLLVSPIVSVLQPYLTAAGVSSAATFSPFSTTFTANHTGVDQVLDRTALNTGLLSFTVDSGNGSAAGTLATTVNVTTTVGTTGSLGQVAVTATTTNSVNSTISSSQQTVPVGSSSQQTDLANAESGVLKLFNDLIALAKSKGANLVSSDVQAFIDTNFLDFNNGTAAGFAANVASSLIKWTAAGTVSASIYRVGSFADVSSTNQVLQATVAISVAPTGGGAPVLVANAGHYDNPNDGLQYRLQGDGSWKFYGNQQQFGARVSLQESRYYDATSNTPNTPRNGLGMPVQVTTATGSLTAASVTGPANSLPNCALSPSPLTLAAVTLTKAAGTFNGGTEDQFNFSCSTLSGLPPVGTQYTFALTQTTGGAVVSETSALNSATNDNGDLTGINGMSRASFAAANTVSAVAGTTLTLTYSPPTSYTVLYSFLTGFCRNASEVSTNSGGSEIQGQYDVIVGGTNSGMIAIPALCDGSTTASVSLSVSFVGTNGESSTVQQNLHP